MVNFSSIVEEKERVKKSKATKPTKKVHKLKDIS